MKLRMPKLTFWSIIVGVILIAGLYAAVIRVGGGLRGATHLSDEFPWGIWVGFDVLVGVGLAAGGFVIAATVHIFNIKKYESISRPTILTAFLGYILVIIALLFDLGRPYRIWHPLVMWNPHSVMFEVAWCVMLYTFVLALEFSPVVLEKFNLKIPLKWVRAIYLPVVIAGVLLSTLHQSSLGTLYVIVPDKLYGLWYSPLLPLFFFITAIAAGLAMTILESFLSFRAFGKRLEYNVLVGMSRVIVVVLAVYLAFKLQDLSRRGNLPLIFQFNQKSVLFWGEVGVGAILPIIIFFIKRIRESKTGLFFFALMVILGFILNRLNVSITGMLNSESYLPKWTEIAISISIVTLGFVIFGIAVKHFPIFPQDDKFASPAESKEGGAHVFSGNMVLAMWVMALIGVLAFAIAKIRQTDAEALSGSAPLKTVANMSPQELKLPADFTFPENEGSPGPVTFRHKSHLSQEKPDCTPCHFDMFDLLKTNEPKLKQITTDVMSAGLYCGRCHNNKIAFGVDKKCNTCHKIQ